ncbi:MAG: cohesin domain-containing protein, partial [Saprospiraceae bacterium]
VISAYPQVQSWTYIPEETVFADPTEPWNYSTEKIMTLNAALYTQNFVAVKMGDVNNSSFASANATVKTRTANSLKFEIMDQASTVGQLIKVDFRSSNFKSISGYQFTLNFDAKAFEFVGNEGSFLKVSGDNFGTNNVSRGILTTSWDSKEALSFDSDKVLFSLTFKVLKSVKLKSAFEITSDVTKAEAYDAQMNESNVNLEVRSNDGVTSASVFELLQNSPNPFDQQTAISFRLPNPSAAILTIYDVTGKVHRVINIDGQKGLNTVNLTRSDLNGVGMFYYQLDAEQYSATKRMVVTK